MAETQTLAPAEAAEEAGLVYVTDKLPGIRRERKGESFRYFHANGKPVQDEKSLERIRSLAIPPAYEKVWICPDPNGHLQAIGYDARGRKQYRYHPRFREVREENKFGKMLEFAEALPRIRERVDADLRKRGLPREKVLACVVYLLEKSLIRVGNDEYAKSNKHYGLTTMRNRHAEVEGGSIRFKFVGKSGIKHQVEIHDRRLARVVKGVQDLPGQELFNYMDDEGRVRDVTSQDVNAYIREVGGAEFTAKDFRTWSATVLALTELAAHEPPETKQATKAVVMKVMKTVAAVLGNTPSVCRKSYVHPLVVSAYERGRLGALFQESVSDEADELAVARLLRSAAKELTDLAEALEKSAVGKGRKRAYVA